MANFFSIPDKQRNPQGYMVYVLTIVWGVTIALVVSGTAFMFPGLWLRYLVLLLSAIFIVVFNLSLNRLASPQIASWSLPITCWLIVTVPCYTAGGIGAPHVLTQMTVILTAGFLLGWRGGLAFGLLTAVVDFGFAYMAETGSLPIPTVQHTPMSRWIGALIPFGTILVLQYYATNHLRAALSVMQNEMAKREEAEKTKDETLYNLTERVKELKSLYSVSQILQDENTSYQRLINEVVAIIPAGWQYPNITAARICIAETEYTTGNFPLVKQFQQAKRTTSKGTVVSLQVGYIQTMSELDEGPFLQEERHLINALAAILKTDLERREHLAALSDYKYTLDKASIVSISNLDGDFTFVNENFCNISKYTSDELLGRNHSVLWSGIHPPEYFDELATAMQNGRSFRGEFCNRAKDGSTYWVDTTIVPFLDENGKVYQYLSINHDITDRKKAEHLIKEQAETFQAIIENTKESIYLISPKLELLQFNKTAFERMRYMGGVDIHIGMDFTQILYEGTEKTFFSMFEDALNGMSREEEMQARNASGIQSWFRCKTSPVFDTKGEMIGVTMLTENIDERKKAELVLRESEEKFRSLVEQNLVGVMIFQDEMFKYVNPGFEKMIGYPKEKLLTEKMLEKLVHKDDVERVMQNHFFRINGDAPSDQYVFRAIRSDGEMIYVEAIVSRIIYENKPSVIGTMVDITGRIEEEKRIGRAVNEAQENERMQIGMELHDNVKQILAGSLMSLDYVKKGLDKKEAIETINGIKDYLKDAIVELRRLSHQLAPSIDAEDSLAEKVEKLVTTMNKDTRLRVSVNIHDFEQPLKTDTQIAFYRILQEQFNNILKFANASSVFISTTTVDRNIVLTIKDDGNGFDTAARKDGIGLANIRRRANVLGGHVNVVSSPGKGCEMQVEVPIEQ